MLDVHPPHSPSHTWKDFFIHVGTICVGLLIAVGLEQSVEAIHRHRQREELLAALSGETQQILLDSQRVEIAITQRKVWAKQCESQISTAVSKHQPSASLPTLHADDFDVPDDPIYSAAKASGKLELLSDEEARAYGELDKLTLKLERYYLLQADDASKLSNDRQGLAFGLPEGTEPLTRATPQQLGELYADLISYEKSKDNFQYWERETRGAASALASGERNLRTIESAERQFDKLP